MPNNKKIKEEWEKELEKKIHVISMKQLENFIRKLLDQQKEKSYREGFYDANVKLNK